MTTVGHSASRARPYPPGSLLGKLKKRGIIGALAAITGSGWLIYEIVHFILIEHYHLPERLKDVCIVSTLSVLVCTLTWRWFRGERRKRKFKWEYVLLPGFILAGVLLNLNYLLRLGEESTGSESATLEETPWQNSVAILPFVNMSPDQEQEYFCDGLTEELITKLSQIQELKVAARTSAFAFKGENADIREVGRKLRVENVLEGSVRKSGPRIRISAQLISVADGYHLWSETYDRELDDIFAIQDEIARSVAGTLQVTLLRADEAVLETRNSEAFNALLMGRFFYGKQTRESLEKSIAYYEQAIKLDPGFARAWAGLAAAYAFQAGVGYISPKQGYDQARAAVEKALELDKNLAFAHRIMGWIQMSCDWDWAAADESYQRALYLEPRRGQVEAAQLAIALARFAAAEALALKTVELDPISVQPYATLALAYWYGGRLDEAVAAYRKILEFMPENQAIRGLIGLVFLTQSRPREALVELDQVSDPFWRLPGLAIAYHLLGRRTESDVALGELIEEYQAGGAYNVAQVYAFRGEADQAFEWLDKAYAQHDGGLFLAMVDPLLANLRADPRYAALLKKLRLPPSDFLPAHSSR